MAAFGAQFIHFSPIKSELAGESPTYDKPVQLGALVSANLTVNLASGEIYGDDKLDERIEEFVSGQLAVELTDMKDEVEAKISGAKFKGGDSGELIDNTADEVPEGGVAYYKVLMRGGKKVYKAYFYPKAKATIGNDNAQTKGSSINFTTTPVTFTIFEDNAGNWRHRQTFETEKEAQDYVLKSLGNTDE